MASGAHTAERLVWTAREREVLDLIARGHTNGEIAGELGISFATAKWHVSELITKLGVELPRRRGGVLEAGAERPASRGTLRARPAGPAGGKARCGRRDGSWPGGRRRRCLGDVRDPARRTIVLPPRSQQHHRRPLPHPYGTSAQARRRAARPLLQHRAVTAITRTIRTLPTTTKAIATSAGSPCPGTSIRSTCMVAICVARS